MHHLFRAGVVGFPPSRRTCFEWCQKTVGEIGAEGEGHGDQRK